MPLPTPQLDDRSFSELVATLREQIPGYSREWTDFNPSDAGVMLLELWCWLAEMILYRMNQIPPRSETNFFKLILDPPEPVTAEVTLILHPQIGDRPVTIPAGTGFATRLLSPPELPPEVEAILKNGQLIFETYRPVSIPADSLSSPPDLSPVALASPPEVTQVSFSVRSRVVVEDEELGISTGQPDQIFSLKRGPVLLDNSNTGNGPNIYNPNPRIRVGGVVSLSSPPDVSPTAFASPPDITERWEYVPDLLDARPDAKQFMVEQLTGGIRFGNGTLLFGIGLSLENDLDNSPTISQCLKEEFFYNGISLALGAIVSKEDGQWLIDDAEHNDKYIVVKEDHELRVYGGRGKIPPEGSRIFVEQYQIVLGKEVKIGRDMLTEIADLHRLPFSALDILDIANTPAEGGANLYTRETARSSGLASLQETFRAITTADFEELASTLYNRAQESDLVTEEPSKRVARAVAVPGKNLESPQPFNDEPATVSVIILPQPQSPQEVQLRPTPELLASVERFLEQRRLITTRLHVVGPTYVAVSLNIAVAAEPRTEAQHVRDTIVERLQQFFHPLTGGAQGNGWPIGRHVYKSELYQLIESVAGVDHVNTIELNRDASPKPMTLAENELPFIDTITISF